MTSRKIAGTASGFTPVFDVIAQNPELGPVAALVFGRVWRYCEMKSSLCYASRERMAQETGLSYKTFERWLKVLCSEGYLEDTTPDRRNKPHEYSDAGRVRMIVKVEVENGGGTASPTTPEVGQRVQAGRTESPSRGRTESPLKRQYKKERTNNTAAAAQNLKTLTGYGVIPSYSNSQRVATLSHVTPDLIRAWGDHLQKQPNVNNPSGLLLKILEGCQGQGPLAERDVFAGVEVFADVEMFA